MPERVIWTALPNGVVGEGAQRRLRLSAFVSPRLHADTPDTTLQRFPDFLDWPEKIAGASFSVQLGADAEIAAERRSPLPDSGLWRTLFAEDTLVRSHRFDDLSRAQVISYQPARLIAGLKSVYQYVGITSPGSLPLALLFGSDVPSGEFELPLQQLLADAGFMTPWDDGRERRTRAKLREPAEKLKNHEHVARFLLFHRPPRAAAVPPPTADDPDTVLDFHQAVASLGDYPELLRLLGLVVDLEIPAEGVTQSPDARPLRVRARWQPSDSASPHPDVSPQTLAVWNGGGFASASGGDVADGCMRLDDGSHELVELDVDGGVFKTLNLGLDIAQLQDGRAAGGDATPRELGLPTLRSAGLALVRHERAGHLRRRLQESKAGNDALEDTNPEDVRMLAEQLVRGHRIDVWDSRSQAWRSLCERRGEYKFGSPGDPRHRILDAIDDEGFVQLAAAATPTPAGADRPADVDLRVPEALTRWDGWSLSARRPGLDVGEAGEVQSDENEPVTPFKLETAFSALPNSLPTLRFGVGYRLRARTVDLAGNSVRLADAPDDHCLPALDAPPRPYLRFDPVSPPAVVLREQLGPSNAPGESLERIVVRSVNADASRDGDPSAAVSERHLAPPRTSPAMAEAHGMFDDAAGRPRADAATYDLIKKRDAGRLAEGEDGSPVEPAERLVLPYLPDVLARGAAMRDLPGAPEGTFGTVDASGALEYRSVSGTDPGSLTHVGFGAGWPDRAPFRLVVREGTDAPRWDARARTLSVALAKAQTAVVRLSCHVAKDDLPLFGIWSWLREEIAAQARELRYDHEGLRTLAEQVAELSRLAVDGGHWMLTPWRELTLVHAVQQPIGHPQIGWWSVLRNPGETSARLIGNVRLHAPSTGRIDVMAEWDEFVDEGLTPTEPRRAATQVAAVPVVLGASVMTEPGRPGTALALYDAEDDELRFTGDVGPAHEFGDTKHRLVRYGAVATTRFAEYFRAERHVSLPAGVAVRLDAGGIAPQSETVVKPDDRTRYVRDDGSGGDYKMDYVAGTVARTDSSSIPASATVRIEYLPPITRRSQRTVAVHVPSSTRPAPPKVLYVVPAYDWTRDTSTNLIGSQRSGSWLRVYLDRPWYSSGEGEQLGVVCSDHESARGFVTEWGADPAYRWSRDPEFPPATEHFPSRTAAERDLILAETPAGIPVAVAAHDVQFDADRLLWYSDIEVRPFAGVQQPFIRLALARYQAHSTSNAAKLSRVVLADFAQLSQDRSMLVTYDPSRPQQLEVSVSGLTNLGTRAEGDADASARVQLAVEQRRPGAFDELGWEPAQGVGIEQETNSPPDDELLWRGVITLPDGRALDEFRVVVREFDALRDDAGQTRLVYADAVELAPLGPERSTTTTALVSSPNPSSFSQPVSFTATVASQVPTAPSGTVTFRDGSVTLGAVPLQAGTASITTAELQAGVHHITAAYRGDGTFAPSRGEVVHHVERAKSEIDVVPRLEIHGETPF